MPANDMGFNQRVLNNDKNGLAHGKVLNINNNPKENNVINASAYNSNSSLMTRQVHEG